MRDANPPDLARAALQLLALGALIAASFWIVRPFLVAFTWATMIVVATWRVLLRVQVWLGGRRSLAVVLMTTGLLATLVLPFYLAVAEVVDSSHEIMDWSRSLATLTVHEPPAWVAGVPLVGAKLERRWHEMAAEGSAGISPRLAPVAGEVALWFVARVGSVGHLVYHFALTVLITAILYANGEAAAQTVNRLAGRLAGARGENAVRLAALAVRAVAFGVAGTAVVQSVVAGISLAVAGIPFATALTLVMFVLAVAQVGVWPVLAMAVVWVFKTSSGLWATAFLLWAVFCGTFDNWLRPSLIKRGADLPALLIFVGVIGGLGAFGVVGLFIGPVVLAVGYTLFVDWVSEDDPNSEAKEAGR